jgi:hypothetical protein
MTRSLLLIVVVLLVVVGAIPAHANCYTVPDWRTGLNRVICQPDQPVADSTVDPSIPLQAGQNLPHFGPDLGQGQPGGVNCVSRQIGSAVYTNCR